MKDRSSQIESNRGADDGFALIELLATLAVFGLLSVLIASGVVPARRAWIQLEARTQASDTVVAAQSVLRDRIARLQPLARFAGTSTTTEVVGGPTELIFFAPGSQNFGPSELRHYVLKLEPSGDLVLDSTSDLARSPDPDRHEVVARGVQDLDMAYFGVAAPEATAQWRDRWDGPATAPLLIRVRATFRPQDRRVWPDLIIRPFSVIDTNCQIDPQSGVCRGRS